MSIIGMVAWVGLGGVAVRIAGWSLANHPTVFWCVFVLTAIVVSAVGLFLFWRVATEVEFWRRGYRVRQLEPRDFFRWSLGPKKCVYEERGFDGRVQSLPFVRVVLSDGYPAPSEVRLPKEEEWGAQMPSWAAGRRNEILKRMKYCLGGERSSTRFVSPS